MRLERYEKESGELVVRMTSTEFALAYGAAVSEMKGPQIDAYEALCKEFSGVMKAAEQHSQS